MTKHPYVLMALVIVFLFAACNSESPSNLIATPSRAPITPSATPTDLAGLITTPTIPPFPTATIPPPTIRTRIAFVSNGDIYLMNEDGSNWINLTMSESVPDTVPAWSPDGTQVAFVSIRNLISNIYIMNADGSGERMLTRNKKQTISTGFPTWSPDGKKIAYESCNQGDIDTCELYILNVGEITPTRLTENEFYDGNPSWSPDGSQISFVSNRDGFYEIYSMEVDGSHLTQLTKDKGEDYAPSWSPDGEKIAYTSCSGITADRCEIYVVQADGSQPIQLTDNQANDAYPSWSPDGTRLVFESDRDAPLMKTVLPDFTVRDGSDIYVMYAADGSNQTRLTAKSEADNGLPAWSPIPKNWLEPYPR